MTQSGGGGGGGGVRGVENIFSQALLTPKINLNLVLKIQKKPTIPSKINYLPPSLFHICKS